MFKELNEVTRVLMQGVDTEGMFQTHLADLAKLGVKTINVLGFMIIDTENGRMLTIAGEYSNGQTANITMPSRAIPQFDKIRNNKAMVKAVENGHLAIVDIEPYTTKSGNDTAVFNLGDR